MEEPSHPKGQQRCGAAALRYRVLARALGCRRTDRFSVERGDWWAKPLVEAAVSGLRLLCCRSRPMSMRTVIGNPH